MVCLRGVHLCKLVCLGIEYVFVNFTLIYVVNYTSQYFTFVILRLRNQG